MRVGETEWSMCVCVGWDERAMLCRKDSRRGGLQWPVQIQGWQASGGRGTRQTALAAGGSEGGEGREDQAKDSGRMLDAAGTPCGGF